MGLRFKTAGAITAIFVALLCASYAIFSHIILQEFSTIEQQRADANLSRLVEAVVNMEKDLLARAIEWGHWDETYDFVRGKNKAFVSNSLEFSTIPFDFKEVIILNNRHEVVFSGEISERDPELHQLSPEVLNAIHNNAEIQRLLSNLNREGLSGYIRIGSVPRSIAMSTISDTRAIAAPVGFIIFTREISSVLQEKLEKQLKFNPIFTLLDPEENSVQSAQSTPQDNLSITTHESTLEAATVFRDLDNIPIIRMSFEMPREIFAQGQAARSTIMTLVTIFLGIANVVVLVFLNRSILAPIRSFSQVLRSISRTNDLSLRIPSTRSDEIGVLAKTFNALLENTEQSYANMLAARNDAEKANAGKSLFIAKVSHELRTPIHSITGMLRILLKQETQEGKRSYIQMAQDSAKGLLDTINEILDFSKMQTGSLSLEQVPFSLYQTVRMTLQQLIPRFDEKPDIELCWDVHPFVPDFVAGDPLRLKNILTNLLGNAFKFTHKGHVSLKIEPYPVRGTGKTGIRFEVADSGIGIHEDRLHSIFDPFTTGDDSIARLYSGTGLGLAIVKQVTEQMGGSITAHSALHQGTKFVVEIPFTTIESSANCTLTPLEVPKSVAILSDIGHGCISLVEGLERYGWKTTVFSSDQSDAISGLIEYLPSFDLIHISSSQTLLVDELVPLLRAADKSHTPVVMAVRASEMTSLDRFATSDTFFLTNKPLSALDLLLISSGRLTPSTTISNEEETHVPSKHSLNVLVADDAATNRIILKTLLEEAGHTVEVVENGQQLVDRIVRTADCPRNSKTIDLVMTDIQMPMMDGLTAAQKVREHEKSCTRNSPVPIIAVTAYAFPDECSQMKASGIDHIITKPISPRRLSSLLAQITCQVVSEDVDLDEDTGETEIVRDLRTMIGNLSISLGLADSPNAASWSDTQPILDIDDIFDRSGSSLRRTALILSGFLSSYTEPLDSLRSHPLPLEPSTTLRRAAHSLKGLLLDVGAKQLAQSAAEVEQYAIQAPHKISQALLDNCAQRIASLARLIEKVVALMPELEIVAALPSISAEFITTPPPEEHN